jgi:hypothetical protein
MARGRDKAQRTGLPTGAPPLLLSREAFREAVLARDGSACIVCGGTEDLAVHHLMERRLWPDGGYHIDNGATLCPECHLKAERTLISPDELRERAGIGCVLLPEGLDDEASYTKWGDMCHPDGTRSPGPLFHEEAVQRALSAGGVLDLYRRRFKYPRTLHLPSSPNRGTDGDRVHADTSSFEGREVVVSLKLDGEATTLYRDHIHARSVEGAYHPTRTWVRGLWGQVRHDIPEGAGGRGGGWRLCGENVYGMHSIPYRDLPTYFFLYAIYDEANTCLSWDETEEWAALLGLTTVPVLYRGPWDEEAVAACQDRPMWADEAEGFVVRWAEAFPYFEHWRATGKSVRRAHVKTDDHWSHGQVPVNGLAPPAGE